MAASSSIFKNSAGTQYSGPPLPLNGQPSGAPQNGAQVDPRLLKIMQAAAQSFQTATGYRVEAFPGSAPHAVNFRLSDDKGKPLPNSPADAERMGKSLVDSYRAHEAFAQTAKDVQQRTAPDANDLFRWGGYHIAGETPFDLGSLDVNPTMRGQMGGGTWADGLSAEGLTMLKGLGK